MVLIRHPNMTNEIHSSSPVCVSGVHEARCAAVPGAVQRPAGHGLVGPPTGRLRGTSGPTEVPETKGWCPDVQADGSVSL